MNSARKLITVLPGAEAILTAYRRGAAPPLTVSIGQPFSQAFCPSGSDRLDASLVHCSIETNK